MNQVRRVTLGLLDLPVEILLDILGHLDVYELVRARQVCNDIRHVINSSSELLYSIDLEFSTRFRFLHLARIVPSHHFADRFDKANPHGRKPNTSK
ncbi:hypothetical protein BDR03DRAFT_939546 [Suillus americanus]|nr:hypothetical protein BDR03DRAFT_939546 [Suillus americanus]